MKTVKYTSPYAPQYTAGGDSALVDGLRGGWTYGDKRWQGFLNTDMDITVDLGEMKEISSIAAEFMQLSGPYVWLPREVIISISEDGNTFTEQLAFIPMCRLRKTGWYSGPTNGTVRLRPAMSVIKLYLME